MQSKRAVLASFLAGAILGSALASQQDGRAPSIRVQERSVTASGANYHVRFEPGRVHYLPTPCEPAPLSEGSLLVPATSPGLGLALRRIGREDSTIFRARDDAAAALPHLEEESVSYELGQGIREFYDLRTDGVKQSILFRERPAGSGDLSVEFAVETELSCVPGAYRDGCDWIGPAGGGVAVGQVIGIDREGQRTVGEVRISTHRMALVLPEEFVDRASYPMILDPLIGSRITVYAGAGEQLDPKVAYDATQDVFLVVWNQRAGFGMDWDVYGQFVSSDGSLRGGRFGIGTSLENETAPCVANSDAAGQFLVAWVSRANSGNSDIDGRVVDAASGAVWPALSSPAFEIAATSEGRSPAVCGNCSRGEFYVVWEDDALGQIMVQTVRTGSGGASRLGSPQQVSPIFPGQARRPSICQNTAGGGATFLIAWGTEGSLVMGVRAMDSDSMFRSLATFVLSGSTPFPPYRSVYGPAVAGDGAHFLLVYNQESEIWARRIRLPTSAGDFLQVEPGFEIETLSGAGLPDVALLRSQPPAYAVVHGDPDSNRVRMAVVGGDEPVPRVLSDEVQTHQFAGGGSIASPFESGGVSGAAALIAWHDSDPQVGSDQDIFAQRWIAGPTREFLPSAPGAGFGHALSSVGDLDQDGYEDFAIGHPGRNGNGGSVTVVSGRSLETILEVPGSSLFGDALARGDFDGDGVDDLLIGNSGGPVSAVRILSGASRSLVTVQAAQTSVSRLGTAVAAGHLDADAYEDAIYVGGQSSDRLSARSAVGGNIRQLWSISPLGAPIRSLAVIGDVNNDGSDDIVIGMPTYSGGATNGGRLQGRSGRDGSLLWDTVGYTLEARLGWSIAAIGDVTSDGSPDLAVGEPFANWRGASQSGSVTVYDGYNGLRNGTYGGSFGGQRLGYHVAAAGDFNGDGAQDILCLQRPTAGPNLVRILNGRSPGQLLNTFPVMGGSSFGESLLAIDNDGDSVPNYVFGEPTSDGGAVYIDGTEVSPSPPWVREYGIACEGSGPAYRIPRIRHAGGLPRVGGAYSVQLTSAPANELAVVFMGGRRQQVSLALSMPGCWLLVDSATDIVLTTDRAGRALTNWTVPNDPNVAGLDIFFQFAVRDRGANPFGATTTNGLALRYGAR